MSMKVKRLYVELIIVLLFLFGPVVIKLCAYFQRKTDAQRKQEPERERERERERKRERERERERERRKRERERERERQRVEGEQI